MRNPAISVAFFRSSFSYMPARLASGVLAVLLATTLGGVPSRAADKTIAKGKTETVEQKVTEKGDKLIIQKGGAVKTVENARGVFVDNDVTGVTIINDGDIVALVDAGARRHGPRGILMGTGTADTVIKNRGLIQTGARDEAIAKALGESGFNKNNKDDNNIQYNAAIGVNGDRTIVENSGTIKTQSQFANGIGVRNGHDVRIINTGTIDIRGYGSNGIGFNNNAESDNAVVENHGIIRIRRGDGIRVPHNNAVVTNSGVIELEHHETSFAINFGASEGTRVLPHTDRDANPGHTRFLPEGFFWPDVDPVRNTNQTLVLLPGSRIVGHIRFGGGDKDVLRFGGKGVADSMNLTFVDAVDTLDAEGHLAVLAKDKKSAVVADTTLHATRQDVLAELSGIQSLAAFEALDASSNTFWARAVGGYGSRGAEGVVRKTEHSYGGVSFGGSQDRGDGFRLGAYGGFQMGEEKVKSGRSQKSDMTGAFAGVYGRWSETEGEQFNFADLGISAGWARFDRERTVADNVAFKSRGLSKVSSELDSWLIGVAGRVGARVGVSESVSVTPTLGVRYAGMFDGKYDEKGANVNLSFDARTLHMLEGRIGAALGHSFSSQGGEGQIEISVGGLIRTYSGDRGVKGTFSGARFDHKLKDVRRDDFGATAGLGFTVPLSGGILIAGGVSATALDESGYTVDGELKIRMPF